MSGPVWQLALLFASLSPLAIGGVNSVLPEMQRQVVQVHHWMTATQFAGLFAVGQAAPGPNLLVVTLVGWHVAGLSGALAATLGLAGPPCVLTFAVSRLWHRPGSARWRGVVQAGLTPVTVGLVLAAATLLSVATTRGVGTGLIALATAAALLRTRLHPLWLLAAGAALGAIGVR